THVDGQDVTLSWSANTEPDLAGYHVTRDGVRLTSTPLATPTFADPGRASGLYDYSIVAVDHDGNESGAASAPAVVYALRLDNPFPVTLLSSAALTGDGAREGTTVQALSGTNVVGAAPASAGPFGVPAVALTDGSNLLRARGVDASGNRSIPSNEITLISNRPPAPLSGLTAATTGSDVDLSWD